ncbi:MAG: DUF2934 domain-containing protein [Spirochaetia bacterium]|nr:DUF2934 domain-containing protein [Spirochaetia bacterium]
MEKMKNATASGKEPAKKKEDLTGIISRTAYDLFIQSGSMHGNDKRDWLKAEKMVHGDNKK